MSRFQDAGAVRAGSFYVERRADADLYEALIENEFCYVLAPRQIGKSSLRVRTEGRLRDRGVRCASIDLTRIGSADASAEQWYFSLVEEIAISLLPERDPIQFWTRRAELAPAYRFTRFLLDELLANDDRPVVISFDEIDVVLSLPFPRDEFFAAIRAVYDARAEQPAYRRLTFCLFGVATPGELMEDPRHTPFNIGRPIRLDDFTTAESAAFLPGLEPASGDPRALLSAVLHWTSGHPYMTQRTCGALLSEEPELSHGVPERERVDAIVKRLFLERGRLEDANLASADGRVAMAEGALRTEMFRIYRRLLEGAVVPVRGNDPAQQELRLAGMVSERAHEGGARMMIRNRIFAAVFDHRWVDRMFSENPLTEPVAQWLRFDRGEDFLLHGAALEAALEWARGRRDLTEEERDFLHACGQLEERKASARRASRERRFLAGTAAALVLTLLTGVGLLRERALRKALEVERAKATQHQRGLEALLMQVKRDADSQAAEAANQVKRLQREANANEQRAVALEAQGAAKSREVEALRQQAEEARSRAKQEHEIALQATRLAQEATQALAQGKAAALLAEKALDAERAGRALVEKQLADERDRRTRVEKELRDAQLQNIDLGKHQIWPNEDGSPRPPRRDAGAE